MSLSHEPGRLADRDDACRIDVWLWRARFCKTRGIAAALVERGAVRLTHHGREVRLDKPSRCVHPGDALTFVQNGRVTSLQVEALGERRGPAEEARALYSLLTA
ncbi:S4 domain-containing protein [uncultured Brevundimonas sp.]|uniref:RNA-binding S4 domain-containing protein n=1 Tax=uncultured Brevundimonas sp. TaxID=213418 RepID=UPI0025D9A4FE|nr:S4 domain-containing protein [uncultured Brevundimonas sp.]